MAVAIYDAYLERINALVARIATEERDAIMRAAVAVADRVADDRLVNVIGPGGHSSMGAEEVFYRAGGLACVNALLDDGFLLAHGAVRSMLVERTPGYGRTVLRNANLTSGDVLIIVNAYGVNSSTIDCALYARELGVTTIGVTSVELQRALPQGHAARHPERPGPGRPCRLHDRHEGAGRRRADGGRRRPASGSGPSRRSPTRSP